MTALEQVAVASQARQAAELALDEAIRRQRDAIRAAYTDRWRVGQIATASGLSRVTVHRVLVGDTTAGVDEVVA